MLDPLVLLQRFVVSGAGAPAAPSREPQFPRPKEAAPPIPPQRGLLGSSESALSAIEPEGSGFSSSVAPLKRGASVPDAAFLVELGTRPGTVWPEAPARLASASAAARPDSVSPFAMLDMPVNEMLGAIQFAAFQFYPNPLPKPVAVILARSPHSKRQKFIHNLKLFEAVSVYIVVARSPPIPYPKPARHSALCAKPSGSRSIPCARISCALS